MKHVDGKYRSVRDIFWTDIFVLDLTPDEKLFYLWLFTNQHLDTCGCYQVNIKTMAYETGLDPLPLLQRFTELKRILYNDANKEIILLKWKNNNKGLFSKTNRNAVKSIRAGLEKVKTPEFQQIIALWLGEKVVPPKGATQTDLPLSGPENGNDVAPAPEDDQTQKPEEAKISPVGRQLTETFEKKRQKLEKLFPLINLEVAMEKLINKRRDGPLVIDPYETIIKWMQNEFKPAAGVGDGSNGKSNTGGNTGRSGAAAGGQGSGFVDDEETHAFCNR